MKNLLILALVLFLVSPSFSSAKNPQPKGYGRDKGSSITVVEPFGWNVSISGSEKLNGTVESLPGMAVIRVVAYKPWYLFFRKLPATTTLTVSGLPKNKELHVYTRGYREHVPMTTSPEGTLVIDRPTDRGIQVIIKDHPSTKHIALDPLLAPPGGDCSDIGIWNATTNTCTLNQDVTESITIEDESITLDGAGYRVIGSGTGDGIYTDVSFVTIKNVKVSGFSRGIVYSDSLFTHAAGGEVDTVTLSGNTVQFALEGVPSLRFVDSTIMGGTRGLSLVDQGGDGFPTNNLMVHGNTINGATIGVFADTVTATFTRNNFKNNGADLSVSASTITLNGISPMRGNYWSKNSSCTQSGNFCTNTFDAGPANDTLPWACENGWVTGITCPTVVVPPTGGGGGGGSETWAEVSTTAGTAKIYAEIGLTTELKTVPDEWALQVLDASGAAVHVKDLTDDTTGFISAVNIAIAPDGSSREAELKENASTSHDTRAARTPIILGAVDTYYSMTSTEKRLYSPAGGKDGANNFSEMISETNFPKELVLGIISDETGSVAHALNNELCNEGLDGGVGIMQMTTNSYKGLGSGMVNSQRINDCRSSTGWTAPTSLFYSNKKQGIHANIKDGFRVLQDKFGTIFVQKALATTSVSFFSQNGLTIDKRDMGAILITRAYNGFGESTTCRRLDVSNEYPGKVGHNMLDLSVFFPGYTYDDTLHNDIARKLVLANENKEEIYTCSPVYLQILSEGGRFLAGYNGTTVVNNSDRIIYDDETRRHAAIIFPDQSYIYRVVGLAEGTYDLIRNKFENGVPQQFHANDIPITPCAVHEYGRSGGETLFRADNDCNGSFEVELRFSTTLDASMVAKASKKSTLCHRPPGNTSNAHTIVVGESAVRAHLAHGDTMGACLSVGDTTTTTPAVKNSPGQSKKKK